MALLALALAMALAGTQALAQVGGGTITGTVTDTSGALIPGAEVTARNEATNVARTAISGDNGVYRIPNLQPGVYEVKVEFSGFKTWVSTGNELTVAEIAEINPVLEVGTVSEVVTVSSQAVKVDTEDSQISSLVDSKRISDLPLNGRNIFTLATLQAGVVPAMGAVAQTGGPNSSSFVAAGTRSRGNNFTLDGGHNTNDGISGLPVVEPSVDSVQEFRLVRNNFSAEYGTHSGSVVNVVTKSGTNELHGSVYEFHRNDAFDASSTFDPFSDAEGQKQKAPLVQNQFGFTLGGPVIKDTLFFFGGYEGFRNRQGNSSTQIVETPEFRQFVQQNFAGTTAAQIFSQFPATDLTGPATTFGEILAAEADGGTICFFCDSAELPFPADLPVLGPSAQSVSNSDDSDQFNIRLDYVFNEGASQIFGRYTYEDGENADGDDFIARPGFTDLNTTRQQQVNLTFTHSFSPNLLNEFRFSYLESKSDFAATNPQIPDVFVQGAAAGISGNIGGFLGFPQLFQRDTFQWQDTLSINMGDHYLRAGVDLRRAREDSDFGNQSRPAILYFGLFDFVADQPYLYLAGINPQTGQLSGTPREFRSTEFGWFIQDDWKVSSRLTLNLGIRWDYFGPTTEANGLLSSMRFTDTDVFAERIRDAFVEPVDELYEADWNNFAPRLGFAYDLFGDSSTSLRGGYGISYDKIFFNVGANARFNPPFFGLSNLTTGLDTLPRFGVDPDDIFGGFLGLPISDEPGGFDERGGPIGQRVSLRVLDPQIRDTYVHNFFLGIQRELAWDMVFEVNYQGTFGKKLAFIGDPNRFAGDRIGAPDPLGQNAEPGCDFSGATTTADDNCVEDRLNPSFSAFNLRQNRVTSNYNGFNLQLSKRFSDGLAFQLAYTLGKSLDFNSDVFGGGTDIYATDPDDITADYGRSDFDIRQRFVANFLYELPFWRDRGDLLGQVLGGWQVNAILPIQSGLPLNVFTGANFPAGDFNADGAEHDRPNVGSAGTTFGDRPSTSAFINGVFDSDGFDTPDPGSPGNLGRNTFVGPGFWTVDLSLFKDFKLPFNETSKLQFRAEFFNLLNNVNLMPVQGDLSDPFFGQSTDDFDSRQIQLALKIIF